MYVTGFKHGGFLWTGAFTIEESSVYFLSHTASDLIRAGCLWTTNLSPCVTWETETNINHIFEHHTWRLSCQNILVGLFVGLMFVSLVFNHTQQCVCLWLVDDLCSLFYNKLYFIIINLNSVWQEKTHLCQGRLRVIENDK